jgi:hypothetical protein
MNQSQLVWDCGKCRRKEIPAMVQQCPTCGWWKPLPDAAFDPPVDYTRVDMEVPKPPIAHGPPGSPPPFQPDFSGDTSKLPRWAQAVVAIIGIFRKKRK